MRQVKIAAGKFNVQLPDGGHYDQNKSVTLTDEQFSDLDASLIPAYVVDGGTVDEVGAVQVAIAAGSRTCSSPTAGTTTRARS